MDSKDKRPARPEFNRLSGADRLKLKSAALMTAMSGFIRDDTKKDPWKYPFYSLYLVSMVTPFPFPGATMLILVVTAGVTSLRLTPWSRQVNDRLKEAFNEKALVEAHIVFIEQDRDDPRRFYVRDIDLLRGTAKKTYDDTVEATRHFSNKYLK